MYSNSQEQNIVKMIYYIYTYKDVHKDSGYLNLSIFKVLTHAVRGGNLAVVTALLTAKAWDGG